MRLSIVLLILAVRTLIHSGVADSSIQFSAATDAHGSVNIAFDFGNRLEQAAAYTLTIRKDFKREPLLLCHWSITDRTGQENACQAKEGYSSPGIQGHRLTLTIPKASGKDIGDYTFCMHTDFEEEPTCKTYTVAVVEVNKGEADSSIQCSTATDVHGSANITFDLGSRLEQAEAYRPTLTIRKDFKRVDGLRRRRTCDRSKASGFRLEARKCTVPPPVMYAVQQQTQNRASTDPVSEGQSYWYSFTKKERETTATEKWRRKFQRFATHLHFMREDQVEQPQEYMVSRKTLPKHLLLCHGITTDHTGQEYTCQAKEGYTSPGIQGHRLTLTILNASWKDSGHYTFCMHTDFEEEPTCKTYTVAVVEVNKGEADSTIQCSTATDVHGSANITFDLGSRLEQAEAYIVIVRKDFKREPLLLCCGITTDRTGQESACQAKEGYTSPGIQGHRLTLTILNASGKDSGDYTFCMGIDFEEEPTCKTYTVTVVEVNKDTASYTSSGIAAAEPDMVVIIVIITAVVLTVVRVH